MQSHLNVGFGSDVTIAQLAQAVAKAVGYPGTIALDPTIPDGPPKKLMNSSRLNTLGWKAAVSLDDGLALAYLPDFFVALSKLKVIKVTNCPYVCKQKIRMVASKKLLPYTLRYLF
jgi:hypothetical protein